MKWKVLLVHCSPHIRWAVSKVCVGINGAGTEQTLWMLGEQGGGQERCFRVCGCFLGGETPHHNHRALWPGVPQLAQPAGLLVTRSLTHVGSVSSLVALPLGSCHGPMMSLLA